MGFSHIVGPVEGTVLPGERREGHRVGGPLSEVLPGQSCKAIMETVRQHFPIRIEVFVPSSHLGGEPPTSLEIDIQIMHPDKEGGTRGYLRG